MDVIHLVSVSVYMCVCVCVCVCVASFPDLPARTQTLYAKYFLVHIKYFAYNFCVRAGRSGNEAICVCA